MKTKIPKTLEEARALEVRLGRIYGMLERAQLRGKSLGFREKLADQYIRHLDAMLEYKRTRRV